MLAAGGEGWTWESFFKKQDAEKPEQATREEEASLRTKRKQEGLLFSLLETLKSLPSKIAALNCAVLCRDGGCSEVWINDGAYFCMTGK